MWNVAIFTKEEHIFFTFYAGLQRLIWYIYFIFKVGITTHYNKKSTHCTLEKCFLSSTLSRLHVHCILSCMLRLHYTNSCFHLCNRRRHICKRIYKGQVKQLDGIEWKDVILICHTFYLQFDFSETVYHMAYCLFWVSDNYYPNSKNFQKLLHLFQRFLQKFWNHHFDYY